MSKKFANKLQRVNSFLSCMFVRLSFLYSLDLESDIRPVRGSTRASFGEFVEVVESDRPSGGAWSRDHKAQAELAGASMIRRQERL